jgi:glycosyltransferase involved in cell wall biosynthesis
MMNPEDYPVAIIIPNYNMPERTDLLAKAIRQRVKWPHELIVVENGSDIAPLSSHAAVRLEKNVQTTNAWLTGLAYADGLAYVRKKYFFAYWFMITSAEFPEDDEGDPLEPIVRFLSEDPFRAAVHHALTPDSTTSWNHLKARGGNDFRRTWFIDNISAVWSADWFDNTVGRFDPRLTYAWGVDYEACYLTRKEDGQIYVYEGAKVDKFTDIGYTMNRMNMTADERRVKASEQMNRILGARYGPNWHGMMTNDYIEDDWR